MGGATVEGMMKSDYFENDNIMVSDPSDAVLRRFAEQSIRTTTDNALAAKEADVVIVVVKPWLVEQVLRGIAPALSAEKILIVIAAGVSSEKIQEWTGISLPLFLVIPNIAIAELASMTFIVPTATATPQHSELVEEIFGAMGTTLITDEAHLGAGTTLASCGIAYAMRYVRAASEGGVELGFKAEQTKEIVMQTMLGAVRLLESSGLHPEAAIDLVTTPGGVTIKGLNEMEHAGFTSAVIRGLKAGAK